MKKLLGGFLTAAILLGLCAPMASAASDQLPEGFSGFNTQITEGWAYDPGKMKAGSAASASSSALGDPGFEMRKDGEMEYPVPSIAYLTALKPTPLAGELGAALPGVNQLDLLLENDVKYIYKFYENGITFAKADYGKSASKAVAYRVDETAYQTLLTSLRGTMEAWVSPLWLANIRYSRASRVEMNILGSKFAMSSTDSKFRLLMTELRTISVKNKAPIVIKKATAPKTGNLITITFKEGIVFTLAITDKTLTIYSSDRDYALEYQYNHKNLLQSFERVAKEQRIVPNTGKPVVYLYPERPTEVSVRLSLQGRLGETRPLYRDGWQVTAYPDGRLVDKTDGKQYPYLFWDGWTDVDWDFSEGFVVSGAQTEDFLRERLIEIGLTPNEYQEFLDYWVPEMQKNKYNLISFSTEQYQAMAKMAISPTPDSLLRVHMVYRPLEAPVQVKPQSFKPFERTGFTVVEWGGTRA